MTGIIEKKIGFLYKMKFKDHNNHQLRVIESSLSNETKFLSEK